MSEQRTQWTRPTPGEVKPLRQVSVSDAARSGEQRVITLSWSGELHQVFPSAAVREFVEIATRGLARPVAPPALPAARDPWPDSPDAEDVSIVGAQF